MNSEREGRNTASAAPLRVRHVLPLKADSPRKGFCDDCTEGRLIILAGSDGGILLAL
jgi:hypothetical protein